MFADGDAVVQPQRNINIPELIGYYVSQGYNALDIKQMLPQLDMADIEMAVSQLGGSVNPAMASPGADEFNSSSFDVLPRIAETIVTDSPTGELSLSQAEAPQPNTGIPVGVTSSNEISAIAQKIEDLKSEKERIKNRSGFQIMNREQIPLYLDQIDQQIASLNGELRIKLQQPSATNSSPDLNVETEASFPVLPTEQEITGSETVAKVSESGLKPNQYRNSQGKILNIDPAKFADQLEVEDSRIIGGLLMNPNVEYGSNLASIVEGVATRRSSTLVPEEDIRVGQGIQGLNAEELLQSGTKFGVDVAKEGIESLFNIARAPFTNPTIAGIFGSRDRVKDLRESGAGDRVNLFETALDDVNLNNPFRAGKALVTGGFDEYFKTGGERPETLDAIVAESSTGISDPIQKELDEAAQTGGKGTEVITDETKESKSGDVGEPADSADVASATATKEGGAGITVDDIENDVGGFDDDDAAATSVAIYNDPDILRLMRNLGKGLAVKATIDEGFVIGAAGAASEREAEELLARETQAKIDAANLAAGGPRKPETIKLVKDAKTNIIKQHTQYKEAQSTIRFASNIKDFIQNGDITSFAARVGVAKDKLYTLINLGPQQISQVSPTERSRIFLTLLRQKNIKQILNEGGKNISNVDREVAKEIAGSLDDFDIQSPGGLLLRMDETIKSSQSKANDAKAIAQGEHDALKETSQRGLYISDLNLNKEIMEFIDEGNLFSPNSGIQSSASGARSTGSPNVIDLRDK